MIMASVTKLLGPCLACGDMYSGMGIDMPGFCSKCLGFDHSPVVADDDPVLEDEAKKLRNVT